MTLHTSKKFIAGGLLFVLSLASLAWLTTRTSESATAPTPAVQPANTADRINSDTTAAAQPSGAAPNDSVTAEQTRWDDGYRAGYRDAQLDLAERAETAAAYNTRSYAPRTRVVRVRSTRGTTVARRGHSTRSMILRIAAPAAIGAGIGAIAAGKKGAGIGALIGGGGGALYHLTKHR